MNNTTNVVIVFCLAMSLYGSIDESSGVNLALSKTDAYQYETRWFEQKVDHFNFVTNKTFMQKYLINDTFWNNNGGPIFLYTGNEGIIEAFAQNSGFIWDIAPQFGALIVFAEHRYYGDSVPFNLDGLKKDKSNNGYLTSEQALADFAELVVHIQSTTKGPSPIVAFGGSYGGMLSAWFRIKYPHLCQGAIAASAPVAQFTTPCQKFGELVTSVYDQQDNNKMCSGSIRQSWEAIDFLTAHDEADGGMNWITNTFKLCDPLRSRTDVDKFKAFLQDLWTNVAMMNYPYETSFLMPLPGNPVQVICKRIVSSLSYSSMATKTENKKYLLAAIKHGAAVYYNYTSETSCLNITDADQIGANMWDYQSCTEMVMPFCYNGQLDMFQKSRWNYTEYSAGCKKRWSTTPRPNMATTMYGGNKLSSASNIIFSNGMLDPWSTGGVQKSLNPSVIALWIKEGAHHLDMRASNPRDPQSVIQARKIERHHIRNWIRQYKFDRTY